MTSFSTLSILYVEDEEDILEEVEIFLELRFNKVFTARNGYEGLEAFEKNHPDIILTDVIMPKMDGLQMSEQIKKIDNTIPIILMTALNNIDSMTHAINIGIDGYIGKPVNLLKMEQILEDKAASLLKIQSLQEELYLYRLMVENTADPMFLIDSESSQMMFVNAAAIKHYGASKEEILTWCIPDWDPHFSNDDLAQHLEIIKNNPGMIIETEHKVKGGELVPVELSLNLITYKGKICQFGFINDISERKKNEQNLVEKIKELNFQKFSLDQHAIVSIANSTGFITHVNDKFCYLSGYTREELLGKNHRLLNSGEHPKEFFIDLWQTISRGQVWHGIIKNITKEGLYYWVDATIVPFMDDNKTPFQYIAIRTDITQRIKYEEELRLEKIKAEKAQKIADKANQAKSEFLSSMSHELRTPLNAILGFAQVLDFNPNESLTLSQKEQVNYISEGGKHLLTLINDILNLAKIESGQLKLSMDTISLTKIIEECLIFIKEMANKRGISFSIDETQQFNVYADYMRLKQVLLNLLSNAIKYNQENGRISIELKQQDEYIYIGVIDTGHGIAQDKQSQLFKPFSRLGAENSSIEGTGIGLVVSKEMVQQMGGTIGMQSTVGKGSTFWIKLKQPRVTNNEQGFSSNDMAHIEPNNTLNNISGTLLYVEDNLQNIKLMEVFTSYIKGLTLIIAKTGEEGFELANSLKPDMIILDINLPEMSGIDVLNLLKSNEATCKIPTYALSAAATKEDIEKGRQAGFLNYLTKPLQINELIAIIQSVLGDRM